jgi:hypothetical protein
MENNVSIVLVDKRPYRKIAQDNWGLTNEQMRGKHVHHRILKSDGGTNDPSNLYVCSPSFHRWGWHNGEKFVEWANLGAEKAHEAKDEFGRSLLGVQNSFRLHDEKDDNGKSVAAMKCHLDKDDSGKSLHSLRAAERLHERKDENGKSVNAVTGGTAGGNSNAQNKTGFCGRSQEKMTEDGRKGGLAAGPKIVSEQKGIHSKEWLESEERRSLLKENGEKTSAKLNSQKWKCLVTGKISTAGPLTRYQNKRGIDTSLRIEVSIQEINR